jgi:hypothetical protein
MLILIALPRRRHPPSQTGALRGVWPATSIEPSGKIRAPKEARTFVELEQYQAKIAKN